MQSRSPARCSVLVVDDDGATLDALSDLLGDAGYRPVTATGGTEALALLADAPELPDLILLDLMMPGMDGWQVMNRLRDDARLCDLPVVIMSAGGGALLATAPVADAYLTKPVDADQLLYVVHRTLTLAAMRSTPRKTSATMRCPDVAEEPPDEHTG